MEAKAFSVALAAMFLIAIFAGCIGEEKQRYKDSNLKNQNVQIEKLQLSNNSKIIISRSEIELTPLLSSAFKRGIEIGIGESSDFKSEDYSLKSSQIAIALWNGSDKAIIVENYMCALQASTIAILENIPILVYGASTYSAINLLGCTDIIKIGNVPIDDGVCLKNQSDIWECAARCANEKSISIDYLAVANPADLNSSGFSSFAPLLAARNNGIVITCSENNCSNIDAAIKSAISTLNKSGFKSEYVCLFGGNDSIPFFLKQIPSEYTIDPTNYPEGNYATDNDYGDLDGMPIVPEIAVGRFFAGCLEDGFSLLERYIHYEEYFEENNVSQLAWQNVAGVWSQAMMQIPGLAAYITEQAATPLTVDLIAAGFTVLRSAEESSPTLSKEITERSNLIWFATHGSPTALAGIDVSDLNLHPCVIFATSCSAGKIDERVDISKCVTSGFIKSGTNAYIAPTRTTNLVFSVKYYPDRVDLPPYDDAGSALGRLFLEQLIQNNFSVGRALQSAKEFYFNDLANGDHDYNQRTFETLFEYVLYGDPAFNPYEPCNEGKSA